MEIAEAGDQGLGHFYFEGLISIIATSGLNGHGD
jgi:hypothetical protein